MWVIKIMCNEIITCMYCKHCIPMKDGLYCYNSDFSIKFKTNHDLTCKYAEPKKSYKIMLANDTEHFLDNITKELGNIYKAIAFTENIDLHIVVNDDLIEEEDLEIRLKYDEKISPDELCDLFLKMPANLIHPAIGKFSRKLLDYSEI